MVTINEILEQTIKDTSNLKYIYCNLVSNYVNEVVLQIYYNPVKVLSESDVKNIILILDQYEINVDLVHVFRITPELLEILDNSDLSYTTALKLDLLHCLDYN